MSPQCLALRAELESALEAGATRNLSARLACHAHLLECERCRELLSSEEALEEILSTLPALGPIELPKALAQRVLARLREERQGARLDALLDGWTVPRSESPALAARVLAGLASARQEPRAAHADLDRLLAQCDEVEQPRHDSVRAGSLEPQGTKGLSQRVLAGLARERVAAQPSLLPKSPAALPLERGASLRRLPAWSAVLALAAAVLLWFLLARDSFQPKLGQPTDPSTFVKSTNQPPRESVDGLPELPEELLASLEFFEQWEALSDPELGEMVLSAIELETLLADLEFEDWSEAQGGGLRTAPESGPVDPAQSPDPKSASTETKG